MDSKYNNYYRRGSTSGYRLSNENNPNRDRYVQEEKNKEIDVDLVIEDNTIYEIDRDCYERLKRKKRKN